MSAITEEELLKQLDERWNILLVNIADRAYWKTIVTKINMTIDDDRLVMPSLKRVFISLNTIELDKFRVLCLGQDPYPNIGVATGFAFSSWKDSPIPYSLENIYTEVDNEYGTNMVKTRHYNGSLKPWTDQGVLLLNSALTIGSKRDGKNDSHRTCGWDKFIAEVISFLDKNYKFVTIAFGADAKKLAEKLVLNKDLVIGVTHPAAPAGRGAPFIGCNAFVKCNELLIKNSLLPIKWTM